MVAIIYDNVIHGLLPFQRTVIQWAFQKKINFFQMAKPRALRDTALRTLWNQLWSISITISWSNPRKPRRTKALLGHHYYFDYVRSAHHLQHSCPEPAAPGKILATQERIWFWCLPGGPRFSPAPAWCTRGWISLWAPRVAPARGSWAPGDALPIASTNALSNHGSPVIKRVTVNYFCLGQKRKGIFTESQG